MLLWLLKSILLNRKPSLYFLSTAPVASFHSGYVARDRSLWAYGTSYVTFAPRRTIFAERVLCNQNWIMEDGKMMLKLWWMINGGFSLGAGCFLWKFRLWKDKVRLYFLEENVCQTPSPLITGKTNANPADLTQNGFVDHFLLMGQIDFYRGRGGSCCRRRHEHKHFTGWEYFLLILNQCSLRTVTLSYQDKDLILRHLTLTGKTAQ